MRWAKLFAPVVVLCVGIWLAFGDALLAARTLVHRDHGLVFRSRWWWVQESLHNLELPARTLASHTSVPLENLINGTYTPLVVVFWLFDFDVAYDLFVAAHVLLACGGVYAVARSLGARPEAAVIAGAVGLAGPVISCENLLINLMGLAWTPWVLFTVHRFLVTRRLGWVGATALALGVHLQGIMPEVALLDLVAGALLLLHVRPKLDVRTLGALGFAGVLGFGIASIELMPALEGLDGTRRGSGFSLDEATTWAVQPWSLLEFTFPVFFHSPHLPFSLFPDLIGNTRFPYFYSIYFGTTLPLAVAAAFAPERRARRAGRTLLVLTVLFALVAMGRTLPLYGVIHGLPMMENGRYPVKFTMLMAATVAAAAPIGYGAIKRGHRLLPLVFVVPLVLAIAARQSLSMTEVQAAVAGALTKDPAPGFAFSIPASEYGRYVVASMQTSATHAAVFAGLALVLLAVGPRFPSARPLLALIVVVDLGLAARLEIVAAPASPPPPAELVRAIPGPDQRHYRVAPSRHFPPVEPADDETFAEAQQRDARIRGQYLVGRLRPYEDHDNDGQSHPSSALAFLFLQRAVGDTGPRLLARAGVAKVIGYAPPPLPVDARFEIPGGVDEIFTRVPNARPYVVVHPRWHYVDPDASLGILHRAFTNAEPTVAIVTTSGLAASTTTTATSATACRAASTVVRQGEDLDHLVFDTNLGCAALVSVLEVHNEQWRATVDGKPAEIHDVDFGFIGVHVPAGPHRVELMFVSNAARWLGVSAGAAGVAIVLMIIGVLRRRPRAPT